MKPVLPCAVMIMVVLFGVPGYAAERLVPYDDFNATPIDPDKWFGGEYSPVYPEGAPRRSGRSRTTGCAWSTAAMAGQTRRRQAAQRIGADVPQPRSRDSHSGHRAGHRRGDHRVSRQPLNARQPWR